MKPYTKYLFLTVAALSLGACQTTSDKNAGPQTSKNERIDAAIEKAAITASGKGSTSATLIALERNINATLISPLMPYLMRKACVRQVF